MYKVTVLLNIREKATMKSEILGTLEPDEIVDISSQRSGFGKLKNREGFVKMEFLEEIKAEKAEE